MARAGLPLYEEFGETPAELKEQILKLRADFEALAHFNALSVLALTVSNISLRAGGPAGSSGSGSSNGPDSSIGTIGRDPQSNGIWGFIAERGYGFLARYLGANYARFFVDSGNDGGQLTPSAIMDMPIPNKFKFADNEGFVMYRVYGGHGQEVGFSGNDDNYFDGYGGGNNGGALDLFVPMRFATYDYGGGTSGGPESRAGYAWQGFAYYRQNYGAGKISDLRLFDGAAWASVRTFHPESVDGSPFVADTVRVLERVTVTIS